MNKVKAILSSTKNLTKTVREFTLTLSEPLNFKPWQFIMIDIPPNIKRAYSVVSYSQNTMILCIEYTWWIWTTYLHWLNAGAEIELSGPFWNFLFRWVEPNIYFFATWIWLPPIRCLIENATKLGKAFHLFFGHRYLEEVYYKDFLDTIPHTLCLSREETANNYHGYITQIIYDHKINFQNAEVYYCGSVKVCKDLKEKCFQLWLDKKKFYSEAF